MRCGCGKEVWFLIDGRCEACRAEAEEARAAAKRKDYHRPGYHREYQKRRLADPVKRAAYNKYQREYQARRKAGRS